MFMNNNILAGLAVGQFCIGHGGALGHHLSVYLLRVSREDVPFANLFLACW